MGRKLASNAFPTPDVRVGEMKANHLQVCNSRWSEMLVGVDSQRRKSEMSVIDLQFVQTGRTSQRSVRLHETSSEE